MERPEYEGTYPFKYNIYTSDFNQPNYGDSYEYDNYEYDNNKEPRYTIILKVTLDNNIFICNRNSDDYNNFPTILTWAFMETDASCPNCFLSPLLLHIWHI